MLVAYRNIARPAPLRYRRKAFSLKKENFVSGMYLLRPSQILSSVLATIGQSRQLGSTSFLNPDASTNLEHPLMSISGATIIRARKVSGFTGKKLAGLRGRVSGFTGKSWRVYGEERESKTHVLQVNQLCKLIRLYCLYFCIYCMYIQREREKKGGDNA